MVLPTAGLLTHLRLEELSAVATGGALTSWADASSNHNDPSVGSSVGVSVVADSSVALGRAVNFAKVDGQSPITLATNIMSGKTQGEVFAVLKATGNADNQPGLWDLGGNDYTYYPYQDKLVYEGAFTNTRLSWLPKVPINRWRIYNVSGGATGGAQIARLDNVVQNTYSPTTFSVPATPVIGVNYFAWGGQLAEFLLYDRVLTSTERDDVVAYLKSRHKALDHTPTYTPPTVVGQTIKYVSGVTSTTVNFPAGTAVGDLLVLIGGHSWAISPPSGWTVKDSQTGSFANGLVATKTATSADITAGSVPVNFSGTNGGDLILVSVRTFGSIREVRTIRSSSGSSVVNMTSADTANTNDLVLYFGTNRTTSGSPSTNTFNRGTVLATRNTDAEFSAAVASETITGPEAYIDLAVSHSVAGSGNYDGMIIIAPAIANLTVAATSPVAEIARAGTYTSRIQDTFNRPDNSSTLGVADITGPAWEVLDANRSWGIVNGQAYYTSGNLAPFEQHCVVVESHVSDCDISVTVNNNVTNGGGITFRAADHNNLLYTYFSNAQLYIYSRINGSTIYVAYIGGAWTPGDRLTVMLRGPYITIKQNGVTVSTIYYTKLTTNTKHGLAEYDGLARFDNFTIDDPPPVRGTAPVQVFTSSVAEFHGLIVQSDSPVNVYARQLYVVDVSAYAGEDGTIQIPIELAGIMDPDFPLPVPPEDFAGLPDPTVAPTATKSATANGHLPAGTYRYSYAAWKGSMAQATAPSPTVDVTLTSENTVTLTYPTIPGADGYLVYREDL